MRSTEGARDKSRTLLGDYVVVFQTLSEPCMTTYYLAAHANALTSHHIFQGVRTPRERNT